MNELCQPKDIVEMLREEGIVDLPAHAADDVDLFDAGLDSMAVMQLIVIIEERWGVVLGAADAHRDALGTPARLAETINSRR